MKGLMEKGEGGIFLHIKHGSIVQESKHSQEGYSPVEVTNIRTGTTSTKYIKRYKGVEALIKKIEWYDKEYDGTPYQGWKLLLDADGLACTLDLPFESVVGTRFMKLAENIDFTHPVEFSAWKSPDDKTAFSVKQNGENVPQMYTRENPGDCPAPTQGFNKKWNFDAQKQFLHERMVQVVIPKVLEANQGNGNGHHEPAATDETGDGKAKLLERIKVNLKDYAEQEKVSPIQAIETWFTTRSWPDVEKRTLEDLEERAKMIEEAIVPF